MPHVYMPNQNPYDPTGANPMGRWDYGPWFWPPVLGLTHGPIANPYAVNGPWEPPVEPGTPNPSQVPESFLDTPMVNGNPYPTVQVGPHAYRFRILNAANDRYLNLQLYYAEPLSVLVTSAGFGYSSSPNVTFIGGGGTGAIAQAVLTPTTVSSVNVTNGGTGYTTATGPFSGGGGNGAAATANVNLTSHTVANITLTNGGFGYTSAPTVTIVGTGTGATTTASISTSSVASINIISPGTGWTSAPRVSITGGNGTGASAVASINSEVHMVPATPNSGLPATWPTDGRDGGVPDPGTVGPDWIQIGTEGGFLPAPAVVPSVPVGYDYNRRSIVVLNVLNKALYLGPAERADVIVDFSGVPNGAKIILYNDAPAPMPGFDPRLDYYTGNPDYTDTGGAPTTLPGYGPNTRTIMRFDVNSAIAPAGSIILQG